MKGLNGFGFLAGRRSVAPESPAALAERLEDLRADPRLVHTSETPSEPSGEAGLDATAAADRKAAMDALRARVDAAKAKPPATSEVARAAAVPKSMTVEEMVAAELDRREREKVAAEARAERERQAVAAAGGPCRWCGATVSWERDERGTPVGKWYQGPECASCNGDREEWPQSTDLERRLAVVHKLLPQDVTKWWAGEYLLNKVKFRWWSETPSAVTSDRERFAYVDTAAMVDALTPKPVEYETREPCPRCGCPSRWAWTRGAQPAGSGYMTVEQWTCKGCDQVNDILTLTSRMIGLRMSAIESIGTLAGSTLGVAWWADSPDGGRADPPRPSAVPFGYIDWDAVRRKAFEVFPEERKWGSTTAWERAREAAGS